MLVPVQVEIPTSRLCKITLTNILPHLLNQVWMNPTGVKQNPKNPARNPVQARKTNPKRIDEDILDVKPAIQTENPRNPRKNPAVTRNIRKSQSIVIVNPKRRSKKIQ